VGLIQSITDATHVVVQTPYPIIASASTYDQTVLADSPTHYWPLNDASGSTSCADLKGGSALTVNGTVQLGVGGLINDGESGAYFPSSTSAYLSIPSGSLPAGSGSFSMEAWTQNYTGATVGWFTPAGGSCPQFISNSGQQDITVNGSIIGTTTPASYVVSFHVVLTYDGTTVKYYVNSVLQYSAAASITITAGVGQVSSSAVAWRGKAAKIAFYNTALTQSRVQAHYAAATSP
jgi:hypothetical protein